MSALIIPIFKGSGTQPESAARGSRQLSSAQVDLEPLAPRLGVSWSEVGIWLGIVALVAGCIILGAL